MRRLPFVLVATAMATATVLLARPTQATSTLLGPPTICWPLEIGEARSLPFGTEPFETAAELAPADVPRRAVALLAREPDADVRMETIRRAAIYLSGIGGERRERRAPELALARATLLSELKDRVLRAEARERPDAAAWFDLGYALAALREADAPTTPDGGGKWSCVAAQDADRALRRAVALAPDDPGLRFGLALAAFGLQGYVAEPRDAYRAHALAAATGAPEGSRLRRNVVSHLGRLYGAADHAALVRACREASDAGAGGGG